ncbi:uncharacterized protein LOC126662249 [Mercurialis annua]|uniref:uncharacterized protein LOC126662249 n=1 Tax=Mercurialis annua TaxID=3986 RepID=UPI00215F4402|nr:uncharacterized protein LOC126662249 [Mercurialis annua]
MERSSEESSTNMKREKRVMDEEFEDGGSESSARLIKRTKVVPSLTANSQGGDYPRSINTMETLKNIESRRSRKPPCPGSRHYVYDNTFLGYGWLLPGWIVEERIMQHGRLYRYYYDPAGRLYRTKNEVLIAWEQAGLILLDK